MLKEEIGRLWNMKKVTVVPIVIGALGCISQRFDIWLKGGKDWNYCTVTSDTEDSTPRNSKDFKKDIFYVSHKI